ncbi:MAG: hypothetical protein Q8P18_28760 [Pseudomonadota bacterium]|nr:hypothetical protein [Pseudomonadota bacterium]
MTWLVRATMCDMMPATSALPGLADAGIDAFLAQTRRETTLMVWAGLVLGATVFALTPILTVYVPLPSFLLPRGLRDTHADRICTTRFYLLRQAIFLLKMYACMCWGQDPEVRRRLNVAPYPVDPGTFRTR